MSTTAVRSCLPPMPRGAGSIRRCRPTNSTALGETGGVAASQFVWHRVTPDVNRAINDDPRLIEPLERQE